jgi:hypothetical protein
MSEFDHAHHELPEEWRRRRMIVLGILGAVVLALVLVIATTLSGGSSTPTAVRAPARPPAVRTPTPTPRPALAHMRVKQLGQLASPLRSAAAAPIAHPPGLLVFGGFDGRNSSVSTVQRISSTGVTSAGRLPRALHGGAAVSLGGAAYMFGGTAAHATDAIVEVSPDGTVNEVARLPLALSDAAAATVGETAYIFGGSRGSLAVSSVLAWTPGSPPYRTAHLPNPLRYAAAAGLADGVIIAGGTVGNAATRQILRFNPADHTVSEIGKLPLALTRAAAPVIGGRVYVIGGRGSSPTSQVRAIFQIDPATAKITRVGSLPFALSDLTAAAVGDRIFVAGGVDRLGKLHDEVYELRLPQGSLPLQPQARTP